MTNESIGARALRLTPQGAQTLSKRAAAFPVNYPTHIDYGQGAWAMPSEADKRVLDFIGGLGAISLGYLNRHVDQAVHAQLQRGVTFSLSSSIEPAACEMLLSVLPWAEKVRFVKTGSEACSGATRIARMFTGNDIIIAVGYHGWHDWYASTREYAPGVPEQYKEVNVACDYNNIPQLSSLFQQYEGRVAAVILEPTLNERPHYQYLSNVIDLCHSNGALCIFDEMVCGFRWALGGGSEYFKLRPDLAVYGKGMANGFPIGAIVGPAPIIDHAWVVSGTFGGEALSLAAMIATIIVYQDEGVIAELWRKGTVFSDGVNERAATIGVPVGMAGWPVHPVIRFDESEDRDQKISTYFFQELYKRQVLFHPSGGNIVYAMTDADIDFALDAVELSFMKVKEALELGTIDQVLEGRVYGAHPIGRNG